MRKLLEMLNYYAPMTDALRDRLSLAIQSRQIKKGTCILKEGDTCHYIYFIATGLVRVSYWLKDEEITSWLLKEGDIFISVRSFFEQKPSYEDITALEDCTVYGITYHELEEICREFPEFCWHRIRITENYYVRSEDKHHDERRQTSRDKYARLMETAPDLLQRVPMKYLYSYLGVSKATFDRIRNEYKLSKKNKGKI
ncbi:MAG TPA: Crp/Fnr family transcriptional regulator [Puia sp.]|jgi:CRP-like cAMP-binding protein